MFKIKYFKQALQEILLRFMKLNLETVLCLEQDKKRMCLQIRFPKFVRILWLPSQANLLQETSKYWLTRKQETMILLKWANSKTSTHLLKGSKKLLRRSDTAIWSTYSTFLNCRVPRGMALVWSRKARHKTRLLIGKQTSKWLYRWQIHLRKNTAIEEKHLNFRMICCSLFFCVPKWVEC